MENNLCKTVGLSVCPSPIFPKQITYNKLYYSLWSCLLHLSVCRYHFIMVAITPLTHLQTILLFLSCVYHTPLVSHLQFCFVSLNSPFTPDCHCIGSSERVTHLLVKLFCSKLQIVTEIIIMQPTLTQHLLCTRYHPKHFSLNNSHSSPEADTFIPILQMRKPRLSNLLKAPYLVNSEAGI